MKSRKVGARHALLFYRRTMDRIGWGALALGVVFGASGWLALLPERIILGFHVDIWMFVIAVLSLALAAFAFVARFLAFVQPRQDCLLIATPFLRLRISYQRIHTQRPMLVQQVFPPDRQSWAQRGFLEPFIGQTALVIDLRGFPVNPRWLKLVMSGEMFLPNAQGIVLMVADWMSLSTEIDSFYGAWLQRQGRGIPGARNAGGTRSAGSR